MIETPTAHEAHKKLGDDIAFGLQQTLACWATDFIDPVIGGKAQEKMEDEHHKSDKKGVWIGEVVGDSAAFFVFLGVSQLTPGVITWMKNGVKATGLYDWLGKKSLRKWAQKHDVEIGSEEYNKKFDEWKEFQSDNFAKSSVIAGSSVALNVLTQKSPLLKKMGLVEIDNTHKWSTVLGSKLLGGAMTMGLMLGIRLLVPKATHELDEELNDRYFTPLIHKTQKLIGVQSTAPLPVPTHDLVAETPGETAAYHRQEKLEYNKDKKVERSEKPKKSDSFTQMLDQQPALSLQAK